MTRVRRRIARDRLDAAPTAAKRELQVRRIGAAKLQVRGEAIGRHHVEPRPWQQHDPSVLRGVIHGPKSLEDFGFACDVGVVGLRLHAGRCHGFVGPRKWPRAVDDHVDIAKRLTNRSRVTDVGDNRVEAVSFGLLAKPRWIAPRKNHPDPIFFGEPRDQIAGVPIGPVDENLSSH